MIDIEINIEEQLFLEFRDIFQSEFGDELKKNAFMLQRTKTEFEGQLTLVVFPFTKQLRKKPEEIAEALGNKIVASSDKVVAFNVVKGFLNLSIAHSFWVDFIVSISDREEFGMYPSNSKNMMMVEYSSPNTNKPLHLGHLRNNFLGYAVAEVLKAYGHEVKKVQIINDRGIHICKSMLAWQKYGEGETPESSGLKGDKLVGKYYVMFDKWFKEEMQKCIDSGMSENEAKENAKPIVEAREMLLKWEAKDPEVYGLWEKMNSWVYTGFDATYKRMGVDFDKLYYESNTFVIGKEEVAEGLESGKLYQKEDGSVWIDLTDVGLDNKILLRSDGTTVYMTQDIGTAILRFKDFPELKGQIYTVGSEQEYHFKALFEILQKLGFERAKDNYHLSYGMVDLPEGKMKSREGTVVDADDLMDEMEQTAKEMAEDAGKLDDIVESERNEIFRILGSGALKYFLLKVDPVKRILFDPKASIDFNGNTGPFIQYTYTRISSLLKNHGKAPVVHNFNNVELGNKEIEIIQSIYDFPRVIEESATKYNPALIANYCYDLVRSYNSFYQSNYILKEERVELKEFWLLLSLNTARVIKTSMSLLGIEMPERM